MPTMNDDADSVGRPLGRQRAAMLTDADKARRG